MKSFTLINTILVFSVLCSALCKGQVTVPSNCEKSAVILYSIPECNSKAYELIFEDDFNGNALDTSKWELPGTMQTALVGASHIDYTSLDNIDLWDNTCRLTAKKETIRRRVSLDLDSNLILSDGLPNLRDFNYTSGGMWTKQTFFHGRFDIRCRMPGGQGFWPGVWLFGGKRGNELDIIDNYLGSDQWITNALHDYDGNQKLRGCVEGFNGFDFRKWHIFSCIFDFDKISFLIDDKLVRVIHRLVTVSGLPINCGDDISSGSYFVLKGYPIERMHLILNLSLLSANGPPGSLPAGDVTPLPASFEIDYVKVWKKGNDEATLSGYPNPVSDVVNIKSNQLILSLKIHDLMGTFLYDNVVLSKEGKIDMSDLIDGMYIITAIFSNEVKTLKIVKYTR